MSKSNEIAKLFFNPERAYFTEELKANPDSEGDTDCVEYTLHLSVKQTNWLCNVSNNVNYDKNAMYNLRGEFDNITWKLKIRTGGGSSITYVVR